jgi:hypothetical protein
MNAAPVPAEVGQCLHRAGLGIGAMNASRS